MLVVMFDGVDVKMLCEMVDKLKDKLKSVVIVLVVVEGGKVSLIVGVMLDVSKKVKVGEFVNFVV